MSLDINLKDKLKEMDEEYGDKMHEMYGPTLMTWPSGVDSARLYMFTSHLKQVLTILDPDVPRIQTGYENCYGKRNNSYKKLSGKWEVVDKIQKYSDGTIYTLVLYNRSTDTYEMIEKQIAENLTEKFGFVYNTEGMDSIKPGDTIKDKMLYCSTSYDKNGNYSYGKNANIYFTTSTNTLEDAIVVRRGWADKIRSVEIDSVQVPVNDNDVLLNLYGDDDNYQPIPKIGQRVKNSILCATRRINKDHILFDFQSENMREPASTDTDYYVTKGAEIYDLNVYYNGEDPFPNNIFYSQLKHYYDEGNAYAKKMLECAKKLKASGSKYTDNIPYFISKYKEWNNAEYKWKIKDRAFGNIIVEFKVKAVLGLDMGAKVSGRFGNKGVISNFGRGQDQNETDVSTVKSSVEDTVKNSFLGFSGDKISDEDRDKLLQHTNITIINDENMPYTDDGPVDILLNASAVVRRLISEPMFEVEINFIANEIRKKICTLETMEEKEDMIFGFLSMINESQCSFFHNMYNGFDKVVEMNGKRLRLLDHQAKVDFIHDVEENGFYLIKPPDACIRYESIKALYDKFDFIKPVPLYIDLYGVKHRKMIKEGIVGSMFMIILKQNSRKNAVARSTFRVNRSNLPAKDAAKKTNRAPYSKSPIKLSEIYNLFSSISGSTLTSYNMFMRSSPIARKSLDRIIATDNNPLAIKKLKLQNNYINANAEILNARLKSIGIKLQFLTDKDETPDVLEDVVMPLSVHGYTIYDSPLNKPMYNTLFKYYDKYLESVSIVQSYEGEKQDIAWREVFNLKEVKDMKIPKNVKDILVNTTKGIIDVSDNNISEDDDEESDVGDSTVTEETDSDSDD